MSIHKITFQKTGAHKLFTVDHKQEFDAHENCGNFSISMSVDLLTVAMVTE